MVGQEKDLCDQREHHIGRQGIHLTITHVSTLSIKELIDLGPGQQHQCVSSQIEQVVRK